MDINNNSWPNNQLVDNKLEVKQKSAEIIIFELKLDISIKPGQDCECYCTKDA